MGLKSDGTVVATGDNGKGCCNVADWTDVVSIAAGDCTTVGICKDGSVVGQGDKMWNHHHTMSGRNAKALAVCHVATVGIREDGTVTAAGVYYEAVRDTAKWKLF